MDDYKGYYHTKSPLTKEEFEKLTYYCNGSDKREENRNRAMALGFKEEGILVATGAIVRLGGRCGIGKHSLIGLYSYVNGEVTIGERVLIGPHCSITSNNHKFNPETKSFQGRNEGAPIIIGDGCWLASGVMVTAGVTIGRGNLICSNAVVTKDTPDYAIIAGTPSKIVGKINPRTGDYEWTKV